MSQNTSYSEAIYQAFDYLLGTYPEVFVLGQGLWSPWYVGNTMIDLDKKYGKERVIDSPVSEEACTGMGVGASLFGYRPIILHPRIDFMILATDPLVNQAAKWSSMLGGQANPAVTIRGIVNRGGEQGAQHSQALHSWFAHIPGLRVVMPASVADARDLFIASVLSNDPVLYIDDRWLYERTDHLPPIQEVSLHAVHPKVVRAGLDVTLVGASYSTYLAEQAAELLAHDGVSAEVIDLRVINPLQYDAVVESVKKTGRLVVVDGSWRTCGLAGEIIACVAESVSPAVFKAAPLRITLPDAPAPTSKVLEQEYYPTPMGIASTIKRTLFSRVALAADSRP
ncbi:MAG: alpha-ketoacid dehydrogenase subunit beta [Alphaproteobacteria bacterium]|nr:alpha-ketoacid dehydrogenase subunit beta [Alphaproteobacteria bacterium]